MQDQKQKKKEKKTENTKEEKQKCLHSCFDFFYFKASEPIPVAQICETHQS